MTVTVAKICRYPVKGLSAEVLERADLTPGRGLAHDRRFALALASTPVDGATSAWMPKTSFLMLNRHERLATLSTRFDEETGVLTVERAGKQVARGDIRAPVGRAMIEEFFAAYMGEEARGRPKLVEAATGAVLSDSPEPFLSIINLASVKDLERVTASAVDPIRFRANVYLDGLAAWAELGWVGKEIALGGARLRIEERIGRCAATNVDPETGVRDLNIPAALNRGFRHGDMGVYATVLAAGPLAAGDPVTPPD